MTHNVFRKYRNFIRRLLILIRKEKLTITKITLQDATIAPNMLDADLAEVLAAASFGSIQVYDHRVDEYGQFTLDRDKPVHNCIAERSETHRYYRIAKKLHDEFKP